MNNKTTAEHHHHHHHHSGVVTSSHHVATIAHHQQINDNLLKLEMLELLGPVRDPLGTVVPMSLLYVVLLLTGTIGNVCTCIVIAKNRYMHTATNFYLFSLAISDLLLLILGLPQELFMLWQKYPYVFGEFFCVVRGLSSETSTNASILTITAFTIERYVAICHPLKSHTMSQLPRAIKTILVIWAVSAICALPVAWQFGIIFMINKSPLRNISRQCGIKKVYFEYGFETAAIVFFLVPITLITVLYVLIGINLRKSSHQIKDETNNYYHTNNNGTNNPKIPKVLTSQYSESEYINLYQRHNSVSSSYQKQIASRRSVIRMLVAVVIAFFFCYSPFHAQRVLATTMHRFKIKSSTIHFVYVVLTHISGVTYYLSATINPILYQLMSRKFRIAFKDTFGSCCPCLKNDIPEITYLNMIGGVNSTQLSRVPSFNSNCSFRRSSSFNLDQSKANSMKTIQSFDQMIFTDEPRRHTSVHLVNIGEDGSAANRIHKPCSDMDIADENKKTAHSTTVTIAEPRFKQFLDVPSIKF